METLGDDDDGRREMKGRAPYYISAPRQKKIA